MLIRADAAIAAVGVVIRADAATAAAAVVIPADAAITVGVAIVGAARTTVGAVITAAVMAAAVTIVVGAMGIMDSVSAFMTPTIMATALIPTDILTIHTRMIPTTETDTTMAGTLIRIIIQTLMSGRPYMAASVWSSAAGGVTGGAGKGRRGCCTIAAKLQDRRLT